MKMERRCKNAFSKMRENSSRLLGYKVSCSEHNRRIIYKKGLIRRGKSDSLSNVTGLLRICQDYGRPHSICWTFVERHATLLGLRSKPTYICGWERACFGSLWRRLVNSSPRAIYTAIKHSYDKPCKNRRRCFGYRRSVRCDDGGTRQYGEYFCARRVFGWNRRGRTPYL